MQKEKLTDISSSISRSLITLIHSTLLPIKLLPQPLQMLLHRKQRRWRFINPLLFSLLSLSINTIFLIVPLLFLSSPPHSIPHKPNNLPVPIINSNQIHIPPLPHRTLRPPHQNLPRRIHEKRPVKAMVRLLRAVMHVCDGGCVGGCAWSYCDGGHLVLHFVLEMFGWICNVATV